MSEGGRVLPQRTKLGMVKIAPAVKRTIGSAYGMVLDHLGDFVALAAIPFAIGVTGSIIILFLSAVEFPEVAENVKVLIFVILVFCITFLTSVVPWIVFLVAWHRFVLLGRRDTHRPVEFHLGKRELKFFGYGLILVLFVLIAIIVIAYLLASQGLGELTISWKFGLSISSTDVLVVLLSVRFLFLFPAIAVGGDTGVMTAWKQSRGVAWRLFWALFLAALPFDWLYDLMDSLGAEETEISGAATQGNGLAWEFALIIIQALAVFLGSAVSVAVLALT